MGNAILLYKTALDIDPHNGNAYNQLGLLEAYMGSQLGTVAYAVKSLLIKFPFEASTSNLKSLFVRIYNYHRSSHNDTSSNVAKSFPKSINDTKKLFEKLYLESISISMFANSANSISTIMDITQKAFDELKSLCSNHDFELGYEYMFNVLIIPMGLLSLGISSDPTRTNILTLKNESVKLLFKILLELLLFLISIFFQDNTNTSSRNTILKVINLLLHWFSLVENYYLSQLVFAINPAKDALKSFHSKFASKIKTPHSSDDTLLKECLAHSMFYPFSTLSNKSMGTEKALDDIQSSKKEFLKPMDRMYSISLKLDYLSTLSVTFHRNTSKSNTKLNNRKKPSMHLSLSPPVQAFSNGIGSASINKNKKGPPNLSKTFASPSRKLIKFKVAASSPSFKNNSFENSDSYYHENSHNDSSINSSPAFHETLTPFDFSDSHIRLNQNETPGNRDQFEYYEMKDSLYNNSMSYNNIYPPFDSSLSHNNSTNNLYSYGDNDMQKIPIPSMHTVSSITPVNLANQSPSFPLLLNSYGSINEANVLKNRHSYLYYGESTNEEEPVGELNNTPPISAGVAEYFDNDNLSSDDITCDRITCDLVNTISFLGLESSNQEKTNCEESSEKKNLFFREEMSSSTQS